MGPLSTILALAFQLGTQGVTPTEILVGMVNAQSGPTAGLGKGMEEGARAAFDQVNAKGGINGRKIRLVVGDDRYEPDRTVEATLKMIDESKVFCLCGYVGTPTSNAALPIVKDADVPLVGLFTGSGTLRSPVTRQIFNIRSSYGDETEKLIDHATKDLGISRVAMFYQDDGFGQAVLGGVEAALKKRNMALVGKGTFQRNTLAVLSGLAEIIKSKPDLVVMAGPYAPVAEFIKQAHRNGLKARMATLSFVGAEDLIKAAGPYGDGVVVSQVMPSPSSELSLVRDARAEFQSSGESLGYVNLEGYVSALTLCKGLEMAGKELTRDKLIQALESFHATDLGGLEISFSATNHQGLSKVYLTIIKSGRAVEVGCLN